MNTTDIANTQNRIPVVQSGMALQSLRDSGHSLPTALAEPIDNSIEADANKISVLLDEEVNSRGKKHVHKITIIDDGCGMDVDILHHYPVVGYSTRYMRTDTIGKYGVGAKLAALNFGTRLDVWSRCRGGETWKHVYFDLKEALDLESRGEISGISPPDDVPIPGQLSNAIPSSSGTIVVWSNVDRLEEGRFAESFEELRVEVEKELSRIFRYFINGGIDISINGKTLLAHDPMYVMENTWADSMLVKEYSRKSSEMLEFLRPEYAKNKLPIHFEPDVITEETFKLKGSEITLRVTLYPQEVTRQRGKGNDTLAKMLRVPENEGCLSFVRLDREIAYTNVPRILPEGVKSQDRFIGIEVMFTPELDDYFGIRNVKRGVEPHGELRNRIRQLLKKYIKTARDILETRWGKVAKESRTHTGEHGAIIEAAGGANRTMPKSKTRTEITEDMRNQALIDLAEDAGYLKEDEKQEYLARVKELPFVMESVAFPGNMFMETQHLGHQVVIRLNTRHRFYKDLWEPIRDIAERDGGMVTGEEAVKTARHTLEALALLIISHAKAESMHEDPDQQYDDLLQYWGQFLSTLMGKVKDVL